MVLVMSNNFSDIELPKSSTYKKWANFLWGWGLFYTIFGGAFFISSLFSNNVKDIDITILLMGVLPLIIGYQMRKKYKMSIKTAKLREYELIVLKYLEQNENKINEVQFSLVTGLSTVEAKSILNSLAENGILSLEVDNNGNIFYTCPKLLKE